MEFVVTLVTVLINAGNCWQSVFELIWILFSRVWLDYAKRLQGICLASSALVEHRLFATAHLTLQRTGVHTYKYTNVKVHRNTQQRFNVATVTVGMTFDATQKNSKCLNKR